jgi:hypothetical protein
LGEGEVVVVEEVVGEVVEVEVEVGVGVVVEVGYQQVFLLLAY